MAKILVADDENLFRKLIVSFLKKDGYDIIEAIDGNDALNKLSENSDIDLAILDVMMPFINGYDVCKIIKEQCDIPVLILTAKSEDEDQIESFEAGADDYIPKPVNFSILLLRVKALLKNEKKEKKEKNTENSIYFKNIKIDLNSHKVFVAKKSIELTRKEFEILLYLIENKEKVLSRKEILDKVWDHFSDSRVVDTHIKNLRLKLGDEGNNIKTIRGYGYKIE